jgi:hypothetical protein
VVCVIDAAEAEQLVAHLYAGGVSRRVVSIHENSFAQR